jgi:hypothetical protein
VDLSRRKWQEAVEDVIMRSFMTRTLKPYNARVVDKMDDACSVHGKDEVMHKNFAWKTWMEEIV